MMPARRRTHRTLSIAVLACVFVYILIHLRSSPLSSSVRELDKLKQFMNYGSNVPSTLVATKSSVDWAAIRMSHMPPSKLTKLPRGRKSRLPRIQHAFASELPSDAVLREFRQDQVRQVFRNDWQNYRQYAWGKDALNPVSGTAKDQFSGWAATLVDSLDTLWIMGLRDEFNEAVAAVAKIDFGNSTSNRVNIFETNIRYLGGLLAAYDLSNSDVLLTKAVELGNLIYAGFNTPDHMPVDFIDFEAAKRGTGLEVEEWVVSASPGTLSLEMTHLSQITGDDKYYDAVARVMQEFHKQQPKTKLPGLWPIWVSMRSLDLSNRIEFSLGSSADSLYEYLPKMYALLGGQEPMYETMTKSFMNAATTHMFFRPMLPGGEDILIAGNINVESDGSSPLDPESEHLACFIAGTMALGGRLMGQPGDVETGAKLAKGCAYVYNAFASGLMPERYNMVPCEPILAANCAWDEKRWIEEQQMRDEWKPHLPKGFTTAKDPRYLLRPEAIESLFILYRITGERSYQDTAWKMFQAVHKAAKTKYGHAAVRDVTRVFDEESRQQNLEDYMESFWFAETLKYFYLIFSPPDLIDLDEFVLNTEAHPFRRPQ
ncbi:glycosyl hydrolase family 47 protein [Pochonia chlamydosporia 170]|uniref:alpha-1,2-Mannosidase n=1 Tax=Pochonia chlamydosporia 170 TaxID=1380566 RepID=A0A179FL54_METCM|nr:glycosyl hydrolase family 47 protein [Pochonia chlamydosporia 170]OAQ65941.1 glycosyl hydrolase family 47 protein [Pochonia chlamydosporia 170]